MLRFILFFILSGSILLTSCTPSSSFPSTEIPPIVNTAPPSPTIVWFPASATPTLRAVSTYTATPEMNPGIGNVILSDDFSVDSDWDTAVSDQGSVVITHNRLGLAAQPGVYLASLRRDVMFNDFYAEITAHPSLCRDNDRYGILFRAQGNSFYRFGLTCNSMIYAERIKSNVRLLIQDLIPSGDAPPGAPGEVRIGIRAVGSEMRFFLNGRFQFSITDISLSSGAFGVFAHGAGETPVSITFSDLTVYDVTNSTQ